MVTAEGEKTIGSTTTTAAGMGGATVTTTVTRTHHVGTEITREALIDVIVATAMTAAADPQIAGRDTTTGLRNRPADLH